MADIATALTQSVAKDGQTVTTADMPMGGFKHTNVAVAAARTQYARADQVQDGAFVWGGTAGGTANAHTISLTPAIAAYTTGMRIVYIAPALSNTAAVTVDINSLGTKTIKTIDGFDLAPLDIPISALVQIVYDGTNFRLAHHLPPRINLISNSGMTMDQRNAGSPVTPTAGTYTLDRWAIAVGAASKIQVDQITAGIPAGAANAVMLKVVSAYSPGIAEQFTFYQPIEGKDTAHLGFGASGAFALAVSFDFWSTMTGNYGVSLFNSAADRTYVTTFSVGSASTWQRVAVVIPGDTTGTWLSTVGVVGIGVQLDLGSGTNFNATADVWNSSNKSRTTGTVNWVGTLNAEIRMTRVKAEIASPTAYQAEPEGFNYLRCWRFYQLVRAAMKGHVVSGEAEGVSVTYPVPMCKTPTFTYAEGALTNFASGNPSTDSASGNSCFFHKSPNGTGAGAYTYTVTCNAEI
jgi:hypothetical protein